MKIVKGCLIPIEDQSMVNPVSTTYGTSGPMAIPRSITSPMKYSFRPTSNDEDATRVPVEARTWRTMMLPSTHPISRPGGSSMYRSGTIFRNPSDIQAVRYLFPHDFQSDVARFRLNDLIRQSYMTSWQLTLHVVTLFSLCFATIVSWLPECSPQ